MGDNGLEARVDALEQAVADIVAHDVGPRLRVEGGVPADVQRHQVDACVAALGIDAAAKLLGDQRRELRQVQAGKRRSVDDPARLDRLYVAVRSASMEGRDDVYDDLAFEVGRVLERLRRARAEEASWSER